MYVPLHVHTARGSIGDSILRINEYINKGKELGMSSLSVTDHGSLSSVVNFVNTCRANNIKPIIGCELYEVEDSSVKNSRDSNHILLIAKNQTGYRNLLRLHNKAHVENFYYEPRVDLNLLEGHSEGIICTTACISGRLGQAILNYEPMNYFKNIVRQYKQIFGQDFYLEIQPELNFPKQELVNSLILHLSDIMDIPIVATNDVHYLNKEDAIVQSYHIGIYRHSELRLIQDNYYLMSEEDLLNSFISFPEEDLLKAISNTNHIADQCDSDILQKKIWYPSLGLDNEYSVLYTLCMSRLSSLCLEKEMSMSDFETYRNRLEYELETIGDLGFTGYFLVVRDYMTFCKDSNIKIGPGRGSVVGSLVAYLSGITQVDPIRFNLKFERFLSPYRKGTVPDIDVDIESSKRDEVFAYISNKYGKDKCAQVSTIGMRKSRAAIRDVGRILNIDSSIIDTAAKLIPYVYYDNGEKVTDMDLEKTIECIPEFASIMRRNPDLYDMAIKLQNLPRNNSIHAAGTIISPVSLYDHIPLVRHTENMNATSLDMKSCEEIGFIKFDLLSLTTLDLLSKVEIMTGRSFDFSNNLYDDKETWDLICSKNTGGVFQISSKLYKDRLYKIKPSTIEELSNCLALIRGPCVSLMLDEQYIDETVTELHPIYESVLSASRGVLIYQEQLMDLLQTIGFEAEQSFVIMKDLSKKKNVNKYRSMFYEISSNKDISEKDIDYMWHIIETNSLYSFNKSHGVAYATIAYATAWYKAHYPLQFAAAYATVACSLNKENMVKEAYRDLKRFKTLPISINNSSWDFTIESDKIRFGFVSLKGFGLKAWGEVNNNRPFCDMKDFIFRTASKSCNKRSILVMLFADAFSDFGTRKSVYSDFCSIRKEAPTDMFKINTKNISFDSKEPAIREACFGFK